VGGRVGIFEADLRRGKAAALVIDGKRVVLPEGNFIVEKGRGNEEA
jgi:hypothetical protein